MNPRCVAAGGGAELRVDFSAGATGEKRLVNFQVRVNGEAIFDSGPIDQVQLRGSRSLSMVPGSSNTVEVIAMPQDGRSATARKQVGCPGTRPGFRAVTQAAVEDGV